MTTHLWKDAIPAGDGAILLDFGDSLDPVVNRAVHQVAVVLKKCRKPGIWGIVPAYTTLLIEFDPIQMTTAGVIALLDQLNVEGVSDLPSRTFEIPVCYEGGLGPDLDDVASRLGTSIQSIIERHTGRSYQIYCIGFSPGFPLCGVLPENLRVPRRESPRTMVPSGSVAIAGFQTGVYPTASPGGWHILGRTPARLFVLHRDPPILYRPGDYIRFRAIDPKEFRELESRVKERQEIIREVPHAPS